VDFGTQVWSQGIAEGREGHARAQARHAALWSFRQEGQESQAGDRDRSVRGAAGRRKGPESRFAVAFRRGLALPVESFVQSIAKRFEQPFPQPLVEPQPLPVARLEQPQPYASIVGRKEELELAALNAAVDGWHMYC
jgi:hypothetical protein